MTARENIMFAAHFFHKNSGHLIRKHWNNMLEIVGLTGKADRPIEGFSGGKKQCLGIALAQVNQPDLLIFNEQAASRVSDSVVILNQGVLAAIGPIKQIIQGSDCFIYTAFVKGPFEQLNKRLHQ